MPNDRPLNLDEYGIPKEEYRELYYFCLQYGRKKAEAANLLTMRISTPQPATYFVNGVEYGTFIPHGQGGTSDPVAAMAERRERLLDDVRIIERAALIAGRECSADLIAAVTTRDGVEKVMARRQTPMGRRQFFQMRRRFFYVLSKLKNGEAPA